MDDPIFKQKYQKYKLRVKLWEKDFKKKHGRIPSKYDIREASQEIRDSYKMYYKLKTSFLEDTLNDVLLDDGFDVFEMSQNVAVDNSNGMIDDSLCESINGGPNLPLDISAILDAKPNNDDEFSNLKELSNDKISNIINVDENHVIKTFEAFEELPLNTNAWGTNVSKKPKASLTSEKAANSIKQHKSNLNEKLFRTSSSFSKRNPRKSLSRNNFDISVRSGTSGLTDGQPVRELLPDLETILTQKAKEQQAAAAIVANPLLAAEKSKDSIKSHVDEGWLDRNAQEYDIQPAVVLRKKTDRPSVNTKKSSCGMTNIDVSKFVQADTKLESKPEPIFEPIYQPILELEQPIGVNNQTAIDEQPAVKQKQTVVKSVRKTSKKSHESDSDSVVSDSESEKEATEYRHIAKRRRVIPASETAKESEINLSEENQQNEFADGVVNKEEQNTCGIDFSADDNDDKDYINEKPKNKRKKAVAKRVNQTKKVIKKKKEKDTSPKKSRPRALKTAKATERVPRLKTKIQSDTNNLQMNGEEQMPPEEKPLNPEDLKITLTLEKTDITSVPRAKISDLEQADDLASRYINDIGTPLSSTAAKSGPVLINDKREAARNKLEAKIASGKLNENFVTINLQKKIFARGKKSINYSKYKKKLWKGQKRVAALIGPDMDMGGCDGGSLTCFTCGKTGHMARNCTVKGDLLLPLTAALEEDPTPFMTLEEAAAMASAKSLQAHGSNLSKLPKAVNTAIYNKRDTEDEDSETEIQMTDLNKSIDSNLIQNIDEPSTGTVSDEEILFETDEELDNMDIDELTKESDDRKQISPIKKYVGHKIPEDFLRKAGLDKANLESEAQRFGGVGPLYKLNADGSVPSVTPEVLEALKLFGHSNFRKGQDRAIMRILCGLSTLVTLSTGSGKSLCYQLPAYLYSQQKKSITLVVSPLVSLMEDQVTGVPHFLRAHCLHTNQTEPNRLKIMQKIADGEIDILLVSPEAIVAGERSTGFGSILRQLPPIAFACIDEAHCVSQWSHNFRPSYLMVCKVLQQNLGVRTVLGLTATATLPTRTSIINHLGIPDGEDGIISDIPLPDNLVLSVSKDENKDAALLQLLLSKRFAGCQSIIIYCTRRDECERIAGFLRTYMQDQKVDEQVVTKKKKRKRVSWHSEPYHAGMESSRRRTIQNAFMQNELRIVVATIAFGMGINKPDIRAVIHYNMPRNFESYVQEVGRAGRDGKISHCHLFLDGRGGDKFELRRHIYANSIDRHVIRKLLQRIFVPCSCNENSRGKEMTKPSVQKAVLNKQSSQDASDFGLVAVDETCPQRFCAGHEIGFSKEKTVELLDIPEQNITTLLCYMELDNRWGINLLSSSYIKAKVISYGGAKYLKHAAKECPPLAMAIAIEIKNKTFKESDNIIEFSVIDVAAAIGWNSGVVKYQLKNLEWLQVNGYPKRSPITVSFYDLGFRIKAPGDFSSEEIDEALDTLYERSLKQEQTQLIQLQYVFQSLSSVAFNNYVPCAVENFATDRSEQLKAIIRDYFRNNYPKDMKLDTCPNSEPDDCIINDINGLINVYPENNFSGRNIARIFHGIPSPNYPAVIWGRCKYWRANTKADFNHIVQLANNVIVRRRT